jgi:hypothetical protein
VRLPGKPENGEVWFFPTFIKINIFGCLRKICELASAGLNTGVDFSSAWVSTYRFKNALGPGQLVECFTAPFLASKRPFFLISVLRVVCHWECDWLIRRRNHLSPSPLIWDLYFFPHYIHGCFLVFAIINIVISITDIIIACEIVWNPERHSKIKFCLSGFLDKVEKENINRRQRTTVRFWHSISDFR